MDPNDEARDRDSDRERARARPRDSSDYRPSYSGAGSSSSSNGAPPIGYSGAPTQTCKLVSLFFTSMWLIKFNWDRLENRLGLYNVVCSDLIILMSHDFWELVWTVLMKPDFSRKKMKNSVLKKEIDNFCLMKMYLTFTKTYWKTSFGRRSATLCLLNEVPIIKAFEKSWFFSRLFFGGYPVHPSKLYIFFFSSL